ncbi:unnamed protein product [Lota lota]
MRSNQNPRYRRATRDHGRSAGVTVPYRPRQAATTVISLPPPSVAVATSSSSAEPAEEVDQRWSRAARAGRPVCAAAVVLLGEKTTELQRPCGSEVDSQHNSID